MKKPGGRAVPARRAVPGSGTAAPRWRSWHVALAAVLAAAAYAQTLGYGFVYDDDVQIVRNPRIRSFANLPAAFTETLPTHCPEVNVSVLNASTGNAPPAPLAVSCTVPVKVRTVPSVEDFAVMIIRNGT